MNKKQKAEYLWKVIVSYEHDNRVTPKLFRNLLETQSAIYSHYDAESQQPYTIKFMASVWQELVKDFNDIGDIETAKKYQRLIIKTKNRYNKMV